MTIIGAKKIKDKRTLFSDDALTFGNNVPCSASKNYRRKIRDLPRAKHYTLIASAGTCRESDVIFNLLDKKLGESEYNTTLELLDIIQETIIDGCKILKEVDEETLSFSLLLLDVELNTVYFIEEFSVKILSENVEAIAGSGEALFYKIHSKDSLLTDDDKFIADIITTASLAEGCSCPVFQTNGEDFYSYDDKGNILSQKHMNL